MMSSDPLAASAAAFVSALAADPRFVLIQDGLEQWVLNFAEGMTDASQDLLLIYALKTFIANRENYSC